MEGTATSCFLSVPRSANTVDKVYCWNEDEYKNANGSDDDSDSSCDEYDDDEQEEEDSGSDSGAEEEEESAEEQEDADDTPAESGDARV
jgi:hypothetical protein